MSMNKNDIIGFWTLLEKLPTRNGSGRWLCRCKCGKEKTVYTRYLRERSSLSCGCINRAYHLDDKIGKYTVIGFEKKNGKVLYKVRCDCGSVKCLSISTISGLKNKSCGCDWTSRRKPPIYYRLHCIHNDILLRCYRTWCRAYKTYGARGITVCEEWKDSFEVFYDWAINNGYEDNLTIDRIDNDGNYEPSNCRWITKTENSRKTSKIKINMEIAEKIRKLLNRGVPPKQIMELFGISYGIVYRVKKETTWA